MRWFFTARTFFVLCAIFIGYATTIPWDIAHAPTLEHVAWVPFWDTARGRLWSIPDMVQNVVLFMPFGFFGFLGLRWVRARGAVLGVVLMGLLGFALSLSVESLQTMSATRSPSATDLATNFGGAFAGAAVAAIYIGAMQERLHKVLRSILRTNPGLLIFGCYLVAVSAGALAPFIPTLDIGLLRANVRAFLDDPWGPKPIGALLTDGLLFSALAFLCARELPAFLGARGWLPFFSKDDNSAAASAGLGVLLIGALALALEAAQMIIIGHSPGVQDAVVGVFGAALGAGALVMVSGGRVRPSHGLGQLTRRAPAIVFGFAALAPTLRALQPFQLGDIGAELDAITIWRLVPFAALFENLNLSTFRNVFEASAIYLPLGYAIYALKRSPKLGFLVCLGLAEVLEILQIPIAGRTFDVTEGLYAALMGVAGAWLFTSLEGLAAVEEEWRDDEPTNPGQALRMPPQDAATIPMQVPPRRPR